MPTGAYIDVRDRDTRSRNAVSQNDFTQPYTKRKTKQDARETRRGEYADRSVHRRT